jgi:hypothetical protein
MVPGWRLIDLAPAMRSLGQLVQGTGRFDPKSHVRLKQIHQSWCWKGGTSKTSGLAMPQKDCAAHPALVLIVDDDEAILEITAELLGTLRYDVLTEASAPETAQLLRKNCRALLSFNGYLDARDGRGRACRDCG